MNINEKQLSCLGWFYENKQSRETRLKNQKFLFFYNMFSRVTGKDYTTEYLRAYANGPVYSDVYGDMRHREPKLQMKISQVEDYSSLDENVARATLALVETFTENELSELTHTFDLWKSKEDRVMQGETNIPINTDDITMTDDKRLKFLYNRYLNLYNKEYHIIEMLDKIFLIEKDDFEKLSKEHDQIIEKMSQDENLDNPVILSIDKGVLVIDM